MNQTVMEGLADLGMLSLPPGERLHMQPQVPSGGELKDTERKVVVSKR